MDKLKKYFFAEKIPALVGIMACIASLFIGFGLGYVFFRGEYTLVYADAAAPYQADAANMTAIDTEHHILKEILPKPICNQPNHYEQEEEPSYLYVVTTLDGYIAIYYAEEQGGGLKEITSTSISALGQEELARLAIGIRIYSEESLVRLLQDYGS